MREGDVMESEIRRLLGLQEGHLLDWRSTGCQLVSREYRALLTCPYREAIWQCEVIGPHTQHRWSDHLQVHERIGNGYLCSSIRDMTLAELYDRPGRELPTKLVVIGL